MADRNLPVSAFLNANKGATILTAKPEPAPVPEAVEVYGDELEAIAKVGARVNEMFAHKNVNNDEWPQVIERIITMFDEIGWEVGVDLYDAQREVPDGAGGMVKVPVINNDGFPMRVPSVAILGRSRNKEYETDHDHIRHNVINGLYDGKKGVIDPNTGELKEPRKKLIY